MNIKIMPATYLYQFNCNKTNNAKDNFPPKSIHASRVLISPQAKGRFLVRET